MSMIVKNGSYGVFVEKVFPHVELLVGEGGDDDSELDDKISCVALLIGDAAFSHHVFCLFGRQNALPVHRHLRSVQMLEGALEAKK